MKKQYWNYSKLFTMILLYIICFQNYIQSQQLKKIPYLFDTGIQSSIAEDNSIKLTFNQYYSEEKGYGWITPPINSFIRESLFTLGNRSRLTADGVVGKEITFKIKLPPGEWWFTFWMEGGMEDISTTKFFINRNLKKIVWHELNEAAEGRTEIMPIYRVIKTDFSSNGEPVLVTWKGEKDSVRILGFSFIPKVKELSNEQLNFLKLIEQAGKYKSVIPLENLVISLKNKVQNNPKDAFYFYWLQQIELLNEAERYINMEGWEWANEMHNFSIFDRRHQALFLLDAHLENFDLTDYPLRERAAWNRGKVCYDLYLERGGNYQYEIAKKDLKFLLEKYPYDENLRMLNGEKIRSHNECDCIYDLNAPKWAILQREAICRLKKEIDWWIKVKQAPNGELGGKIDDDVEILREWSPLFYLNDENTITGWKKLADAVWYNPRVYKGFSKNILDVEHSSEFIADSQPELLLIDDTTYLNRLIPTATYFEKLWTAKNKNGRRFFKSSWYSSREIDTRPPRNRDVGYNTRTVKALRYLAWITMDKKYIQLLSEWSNAWLYASLKIDKGKPKGIIPPSIRWDDESINGDEPTWYKANMFWPYYDWEHDCGSMILDQLIFTYTLTKNDSLLIPIELSLELIQRTLYKNKNLLNSNVKEGSEEWAAQKLIGNDLFWNSVLIWRRLKRTNKYDPLIEQFGTPYGKYLITYNEKYVEEGLDSLLEQLRYNQPLRTNLVVHTDRVRIPASYNLKAMLTGDGSPEGNSPYYAITWGNTDLNFTALVKEACEDSLVVKVFNFGDLYKQIIARPWCLKQGKYFLDVISDNAKFTKEVVINKPGEKVLINIPPKKLTEIHFYKGEKK